LECFYTSNVSPVSENKRLECRKKEASLQSSRNEVDCFGIWFKLIEKKRDNFLWRKMCGVGELKGGGALMDHMFKL